MPEQPEPKHVLHPALRSASQPPGCVLLRRHAREAWGELLVQSNHTFLGGASHPEELVAEAARLGHAGIGLCDAWTFGGAVRAHVAARDLGGQFRLAHGARVHLEIGDPSEAAGRQLLEIALYASDRASWALLCRLLSDIDEDRMRPGSARVAAKGADAWAAPSRTRRLHDLIAMLHDHPGGRGVLGVLLPPAVPSQRFLEAADGLARSMRRRGDERLVVAVQRVDDPESVISAERACDLGDALGVPMAVVNDVRMHDASRRALLDTLACIRAGTTVQAAGRMLAPHAERRLRRPEEIFLRYGDMPGALECSWRLLERASDFSLRSLRYEYPDELVPVEMRRPGHDCMRESAMQYLKQLAWRGARERYPRGVPQKVARQLEHEFAIISDLGYAPYFLTVHEVVAFARERGILCQGRGAAANSAVCFALGVTAVDPDRVDVLFERFVSRERNEPPDIDIDFEHERREEVIQHIYAKYGRDRAALVCEVISYRGRSAVRDVGKALGMASDAVERLAKEVDRWGGGGLGTRDDLVEEASARRSAAPARGQHARQLPEQAAERMRGAGLDPSSPAVIRYAHLVDEILGFPRHRSQHVGGFIISRGPLLETVPISHAAMEDRTIIEWDKDDVDALGMLKIDILSLGMLTAIRKSIGLVNANQEALRHGASPLRIPEAPAPRADRAIHSPHHSPTSTPGQPEDAGLLRFHAIPPEDVATYDMICQADTVGVFQIESRAQMSMLPRLRPRCFYDLVIEVAIVRPGPIQGDMVHPYLRRRNGEEPAEYPDDAVRRVLGKTLGVPLFQEQAMALAVVAAGFTPGQADELRRAIAAWKRQGNRIAQFGEALEAGMLARGYTRRFATQVFEQIKGFSGYGFPESHAASFALLVYASAWLKRHHPAAFAAALLNSQPMGFYAPAQIVRDAADHGVAVRPVDLHCSRWDATIERGVDLAPGIARQLARGAGSSDGSERSCRRTQREMDEAAIRTRFAHPVVRIACDPVASGAAVPNIERWTGAGWTALAREAPAGDRHADAAGATAPPASRVFRPLHGSGRSVVDCSRSDARGRPEPRAEPLCASMERDPCAAFRGASAAQPAIRLGFRFVRGLDVEDAHRIEDAVRRHGVFASMADLHEASGAAVASLRRLAAADAFRSMGLDRQQASWQLLALRDRERPLWSFAQAGARRQSLDDTEPNLPAVPEITDIAHDLESTGVSLKRHPIACIRSRLAKARAVPCSWLRDAPRTPAGAMRSIAGIVLIRQRPSTAKGIVFMTIEDESGQANLIFRPRSYARMRSQVRHATAILVRGKVERRDGVTHLIVSGARDISASLVQAGKSQAGGDLVAAQPARDFR